MDRVPALDGLTELASRATQAERVARSVAWQDREGVDAAVAGVERSLAEERAALARPGLGAVPASPVWQARMAASVARSPDWPVAPETPEAPEAPSPAYAARTARIAGIAGSSGNSGHDDPLRNAARAEADAEAAVTIARLALMEAHRAVLLARSAMLDAGDDDPAAAAARGYHRLPTGQPVVRHALELRTGVGDEHAAVLRRRPRSMLVRLGVAFGLGLAYLVFIRLFQWDTKAELLPYLALYALSGVIGSALCTNALSWDAGRVRDALTGGRRLWHVLVAKNVTMFVLVGAVGVVLSVVLAARAGDFGVLVKALGQLVTMMLIWLGVGNVLSVLSPLRVEPLSERRKDGTLAPFLLSFATSYVIGLGVNLMLTWRVWAKESMIEELGGPWIPVLSLVVSALLLYALLTVLAVSLSNLPGVRRGLLRELVDYRARATARADRADAT